VTRSQSSEEERRFKLYGAIDLMNEAEINPVCRSSPGARDQAYYGRRFHLAVSVKRKNRDFVDSKSITLLGIALILLGTVAFIYQGGSNTSREKIIDIGSIEATTDTSKPILIPPLWGGLMLVGGIALVVAGAKKSS
jgi:uncharacterized membrane protein